jgi:hypothetical protein
MASWTEWEFKGEFLTVTKVSELGPASSPADEVSSPAVLQLPCECDGVCCAAAVHALRVPQNVLANRAGAGVSVSVCMSARTCVFVAVRCVCVCTCLLRASATVWIWRARAGVHVLIWESGTGNVSFQGYTLNPTPYTLL